MIRAFILKDGKERCVYLLGDLKYPHKFTDELAHFRLLNDRYAQSIAALQPFAGSALDPAGCAARFRKIDGASARNHTAITESNTMHPSEDVLI